MSTWFHRIIAIIHTYSLSTKLHNLGIPQGSGNTLVGRLSQYYGITLDNDSMSKSGAHKAA